jgi:undecaprenyl-diphosphatase
MIVPGLALAMVMLVQRGWLPLLGMTAAIVGALLLDLAVKRFFMHPHSAANAAGAAVVMGTPSGQALGTIVGYGMVGYFAILLFRSHRAGVVIVSATLVLVLAICFGRLYLGDRYFSDIVSGLAAGVVWLAACITGLEVARRRGERDTRTGSGRRDVPDAAVPG